MLSSFLQIGQCSPHVHFSSADLLFCGLEKTIAWEIAATQGATSVFSTFILGAGIGDISQSALASNRFVEAGMVLGQGVSSATWKVEALGAASGYGGLQLGAEGFSSTCGLPAGSEIPLNFLCAKLYRVTRMDVAVDFTIGVWVDALNMAAVEVGIGFAGTDVVRVVVKGLAITLILYFFLQVPWFSSSFQSFWVLGLFRIMGCYFGE